MPLQTRRKFLKEYMMRRKTLHLFATGVAAALTLSACGGSGGSDFKVSDEPVTLRMTWWGADTRSELTNKVIDAFEKKHPKITVKGDYKDWNGYWDALATKTAAKDSPDVIQMDELYLASYADRGALLDLGKASKILDTSNFSKEALATGQVNGKQYAIPVGVSVAGVLVNGDLFKKYGVAIPDDATWTWDDYAAAAKELTDKSKGAVHGTASGQGFDAFSLKYWARQHGEQLFDDKGDVAVSPDTVASMWQNTQSLIGSGAAVPASTMVEDLTAGVTAGSFATGKAGMMFAYNGQITGIQAMLKANVQLLQPPKVEGTDANFLKPSMYWAVSSQSKHPAEAAEFLDFLLDDPQAADILGTDRGTPANSAMFDHLKSTLQGTDKMAADYLDVVKTGSSPVVTPDGASGLEPMLQRYTQEVLFKKSSPQDAAEAFVKELQGEIDAAK
jgi:multiple sugar transport system substrate-binding protein